MGVFSEKIQTIQNLKWTVTWMFATIDEEKESPCTRELKISNKDDVKFSHHLRHFQTIAPRNEGLYCGFGEKAISERLDSEMRDAF